MKEIAKCAAIICAGMATCIAITTDPPLATLSLPVFGVIAIVIAIVR